MQVFFSWSGEASRQAAVALSTCVSEVVQAVEPWLSEAIAKGAQWRDQLNASLETSRIGVCCLTRENLKAEWILFEAGAISKTKDAHLCTFLLDIKPADVGGPLAGFQHTLPEKSDVKKLLQMINGAVHRSGEKSITESQLDKFFERSWPELEAALAVAQKAGPLLKQPQRTDRELLEEILEHVRRLEQPTENVQPTPTLQELLDRLRPVAGTSHAVPLVASAIAAELARLGGQSVGDAAFGPRTSAAAFPSGSIFHSADPASEDPAAPKKKP
jgi:hypothetical protein